MVTNAAAIAAIHRRSGRNAGGPQRRQDFHRHEYGESNVSRGLAAKVREKGADMVDSPVSGSVITLQEGKLS